MVSHADDQPVGNGNIAVLNRAGEHVDIIGVFEDNIRLLLAQCDADEPLLPANLERNAFCAGFGFGHRGTRSFRDSVCPIIAVCGGVVKGKKRRDKGKNSICFISDFIMYYINYFSFVRY